MTSNSDHRLHKSTYKVLEKISSKFSALKEDITEAVKERTHSMSSVHRDPILSDNNSTNNNTVKFTLQDDSASCSSFETQQSFKHLGETDSLTSVSSTVSHGLLASGSYSGIRPHSIEQLALSMGFGGIKQTPSNISKTSLSSLTNSNVIHSNQKFEINDDLLSSRERSIEREDDVKEQIITKIYPEEMTAKSRIITVPKDPTRRTAMLLAGPKFQLNYSEIPTNKLVINTETIYPITISVGIISLILSLWQPVSSYISGLFVGVLFAIALYYIFVRIYIDGKHEANAIEEWVDFPALETLLSKCDKEDKNTNIQEIGAWIAFQRYDADRDEDFIRYPCGIRLDGYRLILQLASKPWSDERKTDKETKFVGYREYLIKEARMILVPEATLTRGKYWMSDYPIVIQDLQILDKQIQNKQQLEKSKVDINDFFTNTATILSIWFETSLQKEEWFHKLSLVLRKGKEDIQRTNSQSSDMISLSSTTISPTLHRRQAQTNADAELISSSIEESDIRNAISETKANAEILQEKAKTVEPKNSEIDASGTHRTAARKSKRTFPNEASLQSVLASGECLDEAAITINLMTRRLLCDMFDMPDFRDLIKNKVQTKLKEIAISILDNLRVASVDIGSTFPIILKVEPMQWNTKGLWFNIFVYYRGSFKLSVRTRVLLQKLINYDPKENGPIFAQHHPTKPTDEHQRDFIERQKLLATEPKVPEMAATRKLGLALTNLALNKYFQIFANIPFVKKLFEKFSEQDIGLDLEVTSFSGIVTLNIPPPPSDRLWVGFPEMPDLNIKVTPTYGENQYAYMLIQDFLSARIRNILKGIFVLPAMDDQLLPFFRNWAIDIIGEIVSRPINPLTDNYKTKLNAQTALRCGLQEYNEKKNDSKQSSTLSSDSESTNL